MTYLIAEIGSTHDGSLGNALQAIDVFAGLGASALKFQDHRFQYLDRDAKHPAWFQSAELVESRADYIRRTTFHNLSAWEQIAEACRRRSRHLIVSPFSIEAARAHSESVDAFKVASGQVTNLPLLQTLVELGKPVHLSSGMSTVDELGAAMRVLLPVLCSTMVCVSQYPADPEMWALDEVGQWQTGVKAGYSDHSGGIVAPILAAWQGAEVIEVHVTLSRRLYGSDAAHSLEPEEFARLVDALRQVERAKKGLTRAQRVAMLGEVRKEFMA